MMMEAGMEGWARPQQQQDRGRQAEAALEAPAPEKHEFGVGNGGCFGNWASGAKRVETHRRSSPAEAARHPHWSFRASAVRLSSSFDGSSSTYTLRNSLRDCFTEKFCKMKINK